MKHYSQLTPEQRYIIYSMLKIGLTQSMIAKVIGVDKSTVSRELKRNSGKRGYRPKQADAFAKDRQQGKSKDRIDNIAWSFIKLLIENDWFPKQIQGWMKEHLSYSMSHEWIYYYILKNKQAGGPLYLHLC